MLEQLKIKHFQSNKNSEYNFVPGINVLTGQSNSGKTSALRALELLRKNRPIGLAFRPKKPHDTKEPTEVAATFDGVMATRIKSKSINQYTLDTETFDVVGNNVPEEITEFLNLSDDTIQGQHDGYFLLQNISSGEVAKKLNKVANLEVIDFVTKEVNLNINENTKETKKSKAEIEKIEENLKQYKHLNKTEELVNTISNQLQEQEKIENEIEQLTTTITTIQETEESIKSLNEWLEIENDVKPIMQMMDELKNIQIEEQDLQTTINNVTRLEESIQRLTNQAQCEERVNRILGYIKEYTATVDEIRALQKLILNINTNTDIILGKEKKITQLTKKAVTLIQKNKLCPLCGGTIGKKALKYVEGWL